METTRPIEATDLTVPTSYSLFNSVNKHLSRGFAPTDVQMRIGSLFELPQEKLLPSNGIHPMLSTISSNSTDRTAGIAPNGQLHDMLGRLYCSLFSVFEKQLQQKLDHFSSRLEGLEREHVATKSQLTRIESLLQMCMEASRREVRSPVSSIWNETTGRPKCTLEPMMIPSNPMSFSTAAQATTTTGQFGHMNSTLLSKTNGDMLTQQSLNSLPRNNVIGPLDTTWAASNSTGINTNGRSDHSIPSNSFWNLWMMNWLNSTAPTGTSSPCAMPTSSSIHSPRSSTLCGMTTVPDPKVDPMPLHEVEVTNCGANALSWSMENMSKPNPTPANHPHRSCKLSRFRGRRMRGSGRPGWPDTTHPLNTSRRGCKTLSHPPLLSMLRQYNMLGLKPLGSDGGLTDRLPSHETNGSERPELPSSTTVFIDRSTQPPSGQLRLPLPPSTTSCGSKPASLVGRPIVILNPKESREIFIGGIHTVPLPLWAYKKCLTMVRGEPHELGPRLCLRLLQSLFSLHYLVTHNYNGSGGKAPIDPTVMGAVLRQAQIQFGSGYFFTEPMALGKLRDYLNNAFRVMAFRQRKGERVRSPFWNEHGEPVHGLEAPAEFAETADVIVLSAGVLDTCAESATTTMGEEQQHSRLSVDEEKQSDISVDMDNCETSL